MSNNSIVDLFSLPQAEEKWLLRALLLKWVVNDGEKKLEINWCYPKPNSLTDDETKKLRFFFNFEVEDPIKDYETFTFVQTSQDGKRSYMHGVLFKDGLIVVCITRYPWCNFAYSVAKSLRFLDEKGREQIVNVLCISPMPGPGDYFQPSQSPTLKFKRPYDKVFPFIDAFSVDVLSVFPDLKVLFRILAAMLVEDKILIVCPNCFILSKVLMALLGLFSAFEWTHALLLINSPNLSDLLQCPTPFLFGALPSCIQQTEDISLLMVQLNEDGVCTESRFINKEPLTLPKTKKLRKLKSRLYSLKERPPQERNEKMCTLLLDYYAYLYLKLQDEKPKTSKGAREIEAKNFYEKMTKSAHVYYLSQSLEECLKSEDDSWLENNFFLALLKYKPQFSPRHSQQLRQIEKWGCCFK